MVVAAAPPNLTLLALDRLDLAMYTMAGSLCALYAHHRPYAARALVTALVDLRAVTDAASGEWWQRAWPSERVTHAEQAGHRTLAATVRQHRFQASEGARA